MGTTAECHVEYFWYCVHHFRVYTKPSTVCVTSYNDGFQGFVVSSSCFRPLLNGIINFERRSALLCWWDKYEFLIKFSCFFFGPSLYVSFSVPREPFLSCVPCDIKIKCFIKRFKWQRSRKRKFQLTKLDVFCSTFFASIFFMWKIAHAHTHTHMFL